MRINTPGVDQIYYHGISSKNIGLNIDRHPIKEQGGTSSTLNVEFTTSQSVLINGDEANLKKIGAHRKSRYIIESNDESNDISQGRWNTGQKSIDVNPQYNSFLDQ